MSESKENFLRNLIAQDGIGNGAIRGLQRTMTSIGARIETIASQQNVQSRSRHENFMSSLSSYQEQMSDISHAVSRLPNSQLDIALSDQPVVDLEGRKKLRELGEQLKIW